MIDHLFLKVRYLGSVYAPLRAGRWRTPWTWVNLSRPGSKPTAPAARWTAEVAQA